MNELTQRKPTCTLSGVAPRCTVAPWRVWSLCGLLLVLLVGGCGRNREEEGVGTPTAPAVAQPAATAADTSRLQPTFTPTGQAVDPAVAAAPVLAATPVTASNAAAATPTAIPSPTPTLPATEQLDLARYQYRIGDYGAAQVNLTNLSERLSTNEPLGAEARYLLVRTYLAKGEYSGAAAVLQALPTQIAATGTAGTIVRESIAGSTAITGSLTAVDALTATVPGGVTSAAAATGTVSAGTVPTVTVPMDAETALAAKADYLRAVTLRNLGEHNQAIAAYWRFLEAYPWMGEFVQPQIAAAYLALGDSGGAATAYRRAADATTDRVARARLLEALADTYSAGGRYAEAVAVYDEILNLAQNGGYRAEIQYRAGQALASGGDLPGAIARWQTATEEAPATGSAYRALIELVNRNVPFDLYQRGYIDLEAGALVPAINAYQAYIDSVDATDSRVGAALAGMGQAYLQAENYAAAIDTLDQVIANYTDCSCLGQAWLDKAAALTAQGDGVAARRTYRTFAREYPDDPLAPEALWRSGIQALNEENQVEAAADLLRLADAFPTSERAPLALFIVGFGAYQQGFPEQSTLLYARLQTDYPAYNRFGVAFWLGRAHYATGDKANAQAEWRALVEEAPDTYYGILAAQALRELPLVAGNLLNAMTNITGPPTTLPNDDGSRAYAEAWLAEWLEIPAAELAQVPPAVAVERDLQVGQLLLELDQRGDALAALERIYERHKGDVHALYALSLRFEELGAYRLSIISMARLLELSPARLVEDTPIFLQQRVYPRHFADLITKEALNRGINPLLYFSLIRQESLFEEGARSYAAAQGLAQIIPDTGQWVAERLGHPEYTNEIIYRPHVNLLFGAYYLAWTRDYLDGNIVSALVGYNAGPGNAEFWREISGADDTLFVELLTINEPRIYVQTITTNLYHYTRLYRGGA